MNFESPIELGKSNNCPRTIYPFLSTSNIDFGIERIPIHSKIPLHSHSDQEEVITVLGGSGIAKIGQQTVSIKPGTVLYIPRNVEHELISTGRASGTQIGTLNAETPSKEINVNDGALWISYSFTPVDVCNHFAKRMRVIADNE